MSKEGEGMVEERSDIIKKINRCEPALDVLKKTAHIIRTLEKRLDKVSEDNNKLRFCVYEFKAALDKIEKKLI